jgi:hypothetical protein
VKIVGLKTVSVEMILELESSSFGLKLAEFFEMFIINLNGQEERIESIAEKVIRFSIVIRIGELILPGIRQVMRGESPSSRDKSNCTNLHPITPNPTHSDGNQS